MAWASILLEASMGPSSSRGRTIGQGNLVDAKAMLKNAGKTMAASQSRVFHLRSLFFSEVFINGVWLVLGAAVGIENATA